jgi:hypothetical protein
MKKIVIAMLAAIALSACETREYVSQDVVEVELIAVNPPKHMYVDFREVKTGEIFRNVRVAKRCWTWREKAIIGQHYTFNKAVWRTPSGHGGVEWNGLWETFCK